jgi:hypothetical protein
MREELQRRYFSAAHSIQSAIAFLIGRDELEGVQPDSRSTSPKHMRVGIDMTKAEMGGLVALLIEKGVITLDEYEEAITRGLEREQKRYAATARERIGINVSFS